MKIKRSFDNKSGGGERQRGRETKIGRERGRKKEGCKRVGETLKGRENQSRERECSCVRARER